MNQEQYYQLQYNGSDWSYGSGYGDQMEEAILDWFGKEVPKDSKILDAGCGEGRGVKALTDAGFATVHGVDITPAKIERGKQNGLNVFIDDIHTLSSIPDKFYDYTFSSHTLEHMLDIKTAIQSLMRVTKNKIYYIIPIRENKSDVKKNNPSHTSPITEPNEFYDILNSMGLKHKYWETKRMWFELWGIIDCQ